MRLPPGWISPVASGIDPEGGHFTSIPGVSVFGYAWSPLSALRLTTTRLARLPPGRPGRLRAIFARPNREVPVRELWLFLKTRKKWWLGPIIVALLLLALLMVASQGSAVAPFIYTLF